MSARISSFSLLCFQTKWTTNYMKQGPRYTCIFLSVTLLATPNGLDMNLFLLKARNSPEVFP